MKRIFACITPLIILCVLSGCYATKIRFPSEPKSYEQALVEKAAAAVDSLRCNPEAGLLDYYLQHAKGVLIFPGLLKASLMYGGKGGNGVLLARDEDGVWSAPAFYSLAEVSWGFQAGIQETTLMLVFMNEIVLDAAIDSGMTLSVDGSIAAGTSGAKGELSSVTMFKDIYYFADVGGVYAGLSIEGGVIKVRNSLNKSYYGTKATPRDIIFRRELDNPDANVLKDALM